MVTINLMKSKKVLWLTGGVVLIIAIISIVFAVVPATKGNGGMTLSPIKPRSSQVSVANWSATNQELHNVLLVQHGWATGDIDKDLNLTQAGDTKKPIKSAEWSLNINEIYIQKTGLKYSLAVSLTNDAVKNLSKQEKADAVDKAQKLAYTALTTTSTLSDYKPVAHVLDELGGGAGSTIVKPRVPEVMVVNENGKKLAVSAHTHPAIQASDFKN